MVEKLRRSPSDSTHKVKSVGRLVPQSFAMNALASTWWVCCSGGVSCSVSGIAGMRNHCLSVRNGLGLIMHWLRHLDRLFGELGLVLSFTGPARVTNTQTAALPTRMLCTILACVTQRWLGPMQGIPRSRVCSLASSVALGPLLAAQWYILGVLLG